MHHLATIHNVTDDRQTYGWTLNHSIYICAKRATSALYTVVKL